MIIKNTALFAFSLSLFLFTFSQQSLAQTDGEQLYLQHCDSCHGTPKAGTRRLAPPMFAVKMHYLGVHTEELTFVDAVSRWVAEPNADESLMKMAIRHFNLMPKINIPEEDASKIAEYIFSDKLIVPEAYKQHYANRGRARTAPQYSRLLLRQLRLSPMQVNELNLSDEQLQRLTHLIERKAAIMRPLQQKALEFNTQLQTLDSRQPEYSANIAKLARQNALHVKQMVLTSGKLRAQIETALNPQQYEKLIAFRKAWIERVK